MFQHLSSSTDDCDGRGSYSGGKGGSGDSSSSSSSSSSSGSGGGGEGNAGAGGRGKKSRGRGRREASQPPRFCIHEAGPGWPLFNHLSLSKNVPFVRLINLKSRRGGSAVPGVGKL